MTDEVKIKPTASVEDVTKAFELRKKVFVEEQGIDYDVEFDDSEEGAEYFLAVVGDEVIGTARIREIDGAGKLERIIVVKEYRGKGVGKDIIEHLVDVLQKRNTEKAILSAQADKTGFYKSLGFQQYGDQYDDGSGIMHIMMEKLLR